MIQFILICLLIFIASCDFEDKIEELATISCIKGYYLAHKNYVESGMLKKEWVNTARVKAAASINCAINK